MRSLTSKLEDLCEEDRRITYGVVKPGPEVEKGVRLVRGGDIFQGRIAENELRTISRELSEQYKRTRIRGGELLISLVGIPGEVAVATGRLAGANIARQVGLVPLGPKVNVYFVMYFLRSHHGRSQLFTRTQGAVQQVINLADLKTVEIPRLSLDVQNRIADTLSAYDDLIENNRRRIQLLEQSARLLYKEWFVHLRFPGHEHVPVVDGVPEGWEILTIASVCTSGNGIQTGPFGSQLHQADYSDDGVPVVMPKNLLEYRISTAGIARIPENLAASLERHRMQEGDTVYGRRGDIGRRALVMSREAGWVCGTGCLRLRPDPRQIDPRFFFDALSSPKTKGEIANRARGSTMPNLNSKVLRSVQLLVPPRDLQKTYSDTAGDISEAVGNISKYSVNLAKARDLLLPRLMNGEISV